MSPHSSLFRTLSKVYHGIRSQASPWASVGLEGAILLGKPGARISFTKALARASKGCTELAVGATEKGAPVVISSSHPLALIGVAGCGKSMLSNFFVMQYLSNQYSVLCLDVVADFESNNGLKTFCEGQPFEYVSYAVTSENLTQAIPLPRPAEVVCVSTDVLLHKQSSQSQTVCAALLDSINALCLRQAAIPAKNRIPALVIVKELHYLLNSEKNLDTLVQVLAQARSLNIQVVLESQEACRHVGKLNTQAVWAQVGTLCVFRCNTPSIHQPAVNADVFKSTQWLQVGQCKVVKLDVQSPSTGISETLTQVPFFNFSV